MTTSIQSLYRRPLKSPGGSRHVLFRADASAFIGLGHMVRCRSVADSLPYPAKVTLLLRDHDGWRDVTGSLEAAGWSIRTLPAASSLEADAEATAKLACELSAEMVVTDLCHRDFLAAPGRLAEYHRALRGAGAPFVLSIEDCRMERFASNAAVIPYDCPGGKRPREALDGCRVFEGLDYYICGKALTEAAAAGRAINAEGRRVLICIGGGDAAGLAAKAARAVASMPGPQVEARIFPGAGLTDDVRSELERIAATHGAISIMPFADSIADDLLWADLAVIGEGLIRFEAAMTGTPSLTLSQFEHDSDVLRSFFARGTTHYLGAGDVLTVAEIASAITVLLGDHTARSAQAAAGRRLLDGRGMERIASEVLSEKMGNVR